MAKRANAAHWSSAYASMVGPSDETERADSPIAASRGAEHQFDDGDDQLRASGNLLKSWSRRAGEAFLKPCLPVRRQGAVKTATTCRFLLEAPPQSDVGRSGTGHGQTKVLNLEARTQPECARTEFQSKPLGFYHEHVWQSHLRQHRASSRSPPPRFRRQRCPVEGRRSKERVGLPLRIAPLRSSDAAGICEHGI